MRRMSCLLVFVASTTIALASTPAALEGRWQLVSQTYESGQKQLGRTETPVLLDVTREGSKLRATLTFEGKVAPWPAYPAPGGFAELAPDVSVRYDADGRGLHASYLVLPVEGDDTQLRVEEHYRIDDQGRLAGTMNVRLFDGDRPGGGFTWQRIFEREE